MKTDIKLTEKEILYLKSKLDTVITNKDVILVLKNFLKIKKEIRELDIFTVYQILSQVDKRSGIVTNDNGSTLVYYPFTAHLYIKIECIDFHENQEILDAIKEERELLDSEEDYFFNTWTNTNNEKETLVLTEEDKSFKKETKEVDYCSWKEAPVITKEDKKARLEIEDAYYSWMEEFVIRLKNTILTSSSSLRIIKQLEYIIQYFNPESVTKIYDLILFIFNKLDINEIIFDSVNNDDKIISLETIDKGFIKCIFYEKEHFVMLYACVDTKSGLSSEHSKIISIKK